VPVAHPENAEGLVMAFKAYSTRRYTDAQIAEMLNREGYRTTGNWGAKPFTKDTVNRILRNVFYRGLVKYKGELFPGKHPPLVDQELFDQAQEARARRRAKRRSFGHKKSVYLLAGIVRCEDCQLTLRCSKTGSKGQWRYYRHLAKQRGYDCPEPGSYLRADDLEAKWGEIIARFKLPEDWRKRVQELIGNADEREKVQRERTRTEEKLRRLKQMYRDLIIDEEEYRSALKDLQMQLASLVLPSSPHLIEAGEYLEHLGKLWEQATMQERRDITVLLLKSLYVNISAQEIVAIEPNSVFRLLFTEVCEDLGIEIR